MLQGRLTYVLRATSPFLFFIVVGLLQLLVAPTIGRLARHKQQVPLIGSNHIFKPVHSMPLNTAS